MTVSENNLAQETGMAVGGIGGFAGTMCLLPLTVPPVLGCMALFGAAVVGAAALGGLVAVATEIGHRRHIHDLCEGGGLARPNLPVTSVSGPEKNNG